MRQAFAEKLDLGKEAELRVSQTLMASGALVGKLEDTDRQDFQAMINNRLHRIEVKNEDAYAHSNNLAIEIWQGDPLRLSGLATSCATIVVHTLGRNVAIFNRAEMMCHLQVNLGRGRMYEAQNFRGADNHNRGVIAPIKDFIKYPWFEHTPLIAAARCKLWFI